ncbi:MAG: ribosome-associated translation inhibitor RaiA [Firmicutes bacterium]|nr:ribosome-associated translation inhibitor RaiA [Bacillota bacterium]
MKITWRAPNLELDPIFQEHAVEKLGKLERFFNGRGVEAQVTLSALRGRESVEITLWVDGLILRGQETSGTFRSSVDSVVDKLERQVMRHRTRLLKRLGRITESREALAAPADHGDPLSVSKVVRIKRFPVKPMSLEEALLQMNLLEHDFFLFRREEGGFGLLYRRRGGDYGLLIPD